MKKLRSWRPIGRQLQTNWFIQKAIAKFETSSIAQSWAFETQQTTQDDAECFDTQFFFTSTSTTVDQRRINSVIQQFFCWKTSLKQALVSDQLARCWGKQTGQFNNRGSICLARDRELRTVPRRPTSGRVFPEHQLNMKKKLATNEIIKRQNKTSESHADFSGSSINGKNPASEKCYWRDKSFGGIFTSSRCVVRGVKKTEAPLNAIIQLVSRQQGPCWESWARQCFCLRRWIRQADGRLCISWNGFRRRHAATNVTHCRRLSKRVFPAQCIVISRCQTLAPVCSMRGIT